MNTTVCTVKVTTDEGKDIEILNVDGRPFSPGFMDSLSDQLWEDHRVILAGLVKIEVTDQWRG